MMKTLLLLLTAQASALELTPDTWDDVTGDKTAFIKFFAPWCGHCKKMKPDWDKLMEKYADSETVVVADVDCVGAGKPLCDKQGVRGFPTVKFGNPNNLEDYKGGRDFNSLDKFTDNLRPPCDVETFEHCSDAEKALIDELKEKDAETLQKMVDDEIDERDNVEKTFEKEVKSLQEKYQTLQKQKDEDLESLKSKYNIGVVSTILKKYKTEL